MSDVTKIPARSIYNKSYIILLRGIKEDLKNREKFLDMKTQHDKGIKLSKEIYVVNIS